MKSLLKIMVVLAVFFALTFVLINTMGVFSVNDIQFWLGKAKLIDPIYVFLIIVTILAVDIFIAVPTLTTCILSGYFLGFALGGLCSCLGVLFAGAIGYWLSRRYGERLLKFIIPQEEKRREAKSSFEKYGFVMIVLSRSSPILSEVCACMAGITNMKFGKFFLAWCANSIPYALIASYSGSISSLSNPKPAIYMMIAMYLILGTTWFLFKKYNRTFLL